MLLWEEEPGCSGLLVSLKCLKRKKSKPDEYTELLGILILSVSAIINGIRQVKGNDKP